MLWQYIGLVLSFSLRRSTIRTDIMQILAASALPAAAKFAGIKMPETASNDMLAYIGLATIAFIVLRLLCAPYFIWREQTAHIRDLKLELSKPERLVFAKIAEHRAKARAKLAAALEDYQTLAFVNEWDEFAKNQSGERGAKVNRYAAASGLGETFHKARRLLYASVQLEGEISNEKLSPERESMRILRMIQSHVIGDITAEALALQLPASIVVKTLP